MLGDRPHHFGRIEHRHDHVRRADQASRRPRRAMPRDSRRRTANVRFRTRRAVAEVVATRSRMHTFSASLITPVPLITIVTSVNCRRQSDVPAPERCDMSPRPRIASLSVASMTVLGLSVAIGVAPPATAEPCEGAAGSATSLPHAFEIPSLSRLAPPTGRSGTSPPARTTHRRSPNWVCPHSSRRSPASALRASATAGRGGSKPNPNGTAAQQTQQAPAAAQPAAAPVPVPANPVGTSIVGWVTGPDSPNQTIQRFAITGTDLGIMWDNGDPANHQVLMASRRHQRLPRHSRQAMAVQRAVPQPRRVAVEHGRRARWRGREPVFRLTRVANGHLRQIINSIGQAPDETGIIPTTGIAVGRNQYLNFMSIRNWDSPGSWSTNFAATAVSSDNARPGGLPRHHPHARGGKRELPDGRVPRRDPAIRTSIRSERRRGERFGVRRACGPQLHPDLTSTNIELRQPSSALPANPQAATPVIPGRVGEMSAQYNTYLKQYLVLYGNGANDIVMRTAPAPQGPWGPEQLLVPSMQIPGGVYAPYLHPWSTGKELYYNMSLWSAYNVMLMHTTLA